MKLLVKIFKISLILTFISSTAHASSYGVIDIKKVLQEALAVVHIQKIVNKKQLEFQDQITKDQEKLEREKDVILAKKDLLSENALKKEEEKLQEKFDAFKVNVLEKQNILKNASVRAMKVVHKEIEDSITEISQSKGYSIVFPESQIVYYEESLDITDAVLASVNAKIKKVDVTFDK